MKAIIAVVLVLAVCANAGVITTSHQIHDVAITSPVLHSAPIYSPATVIGTSSSSSYKIRAPAAKLAVPIVHHTPVYHAAPSLPLVHASPVVMSHGVLLH